MAFVVEDGTGLSEANSYVSIAEADDFNADRGNVAWTGDDAAKQAALVKATDYIEQSYGSRWRGEKLVDNQGLALPRDFGTPLPRQLKQAVCVLALEAIAGTDLNPTVDRAIKREKTDVIETEYMDNAAPVEQRPAIDGLLMATGLLYGGAAYGVPSNGKVIRV